MAVSADTRRQHRASRHDGDRAVRAWLCSSPRSCSRWSSSAARRGSPNSGLSITEWQPLLGAIPPLNEADWQAAFEKYKAIPEYSDRQRRHVARRRSSSSTGGSGRTASSAASSASPSRCRFSPSGLTGRLRPGLPLKLSRRAGAGRPAGRHRLVHGEVGARRPHRRQPVPPGAASADRVRDPRRCSSGWRSMPGPRRERVRLQTVTRAAAALAAIAVRARSSCRSGSARSSPD